MFSRLVATVLLRHDVGVLIVAVDYLVHYEKLTVKPKTQRVMRRVTIKVLRCVMVLVFTIRVLIFSRQEEKAIHSGVLL